MPKPPSIIVPQHGFVKAIARALRSRCGVSQGGGSSSHRLIIATSGGGDSVALLRATAALAGRRGWPLQLAVGHVQHHLRDESERDARFVAQLADRLDLPFLRADVDLSQATGNVEASARQQRYNALAQLAEGFNARYVLTAHHGDDQLETMLMRILRGSSVRGLGCMSWRRRLHPRRPTVLLRPMLAVNRQQVLKFLEDLGQPWCQDHTNADLSRVRARLRHDVVPVLHEICGDAAAKSVSTADHLRCIDRWLDAEAKRHALANPGLQQTPPTLTREAARRMPEAVLATLLRRQLIRCGAAADRIGHRALEPMIRAIRDTEGGQRQFVFSDGVEVAVSRQTVEFVCTRCD